MNQSNAKPIWQTPEFAIVDVAETESGADPSHETDGGVLILAS